MFRTEALGALSSLVPELNEGSRERERRVASAAGAEEHPVPIETLVELRYPYIIGEEGLK